MEEDDNLTPKIMQEKEESKEPKLFVDVNIGKQGMDRIVVFEGDRAEDLARNFCLKNGLNSEMEEKLC